MELRGINLKKINEKSKFSINLKIINENFQCGICQGYIIDATTIIDCLHSCKFLKKKNISSILKLI